MTLKVLLLVSIGIQMASSEVFTSIGQLRNLVVTIGGVTQKLEKFLQAEFETIEKAKKYI